MENKQYIKKIIIIILLTNIPAILILPMFFKSGIGWITGSLGSLVNFVWLARNIKKSLSVSGSKAKVKAVKGSLLGYMFLAVYAVLLMTFVKPNILTFGFGLLSVQIAIYVVELSEHLKNNKYFRG